MEQERKIIELGELLVWIGGIVETLKPNIRVEEGFVTRVLEATTGWTADTERRVGGRNTPGGDIFFSKERVVVQVTSDTTIRKIKHTIEMCNKHLDREQFRRIIMFYTGRSGWKGGREVIRLHGIEEWVVNVPEDTWDYQRILDLLSGEPERTTEVLRVAKAFMQEAENESKRGETLLIREMAVWSKWIERKNQGRRVNMEGIGDKTVIWIQGSIGSGKTVAAGQVVKASGKETVRVYELKNVVGAEWHKAIEEAGQRDEDIIWIEDLAVGAEKTEQKAVSRMVDECERNGQQVVITSYEGPPGSGNVLVRQRAIVWKIGNFTKEEVERRAELSGFSKKDAAVAMAASHDGNPTLVDKYFEDRQSVPAIEAAVGGEEAQEARERAEQEVISTLEHRLCGMLAQLAIEGGGFTRTEAAMVTGEDVTGERIREWTSMEGRWLERSEHGALRVSPLLSGLGRKALDEEGRRKAHNEWLKIQIGKMGGGKTNLDTMIYNSVMGQNERFLMTVTYWVTNAEAKDTALWREGSHWLRSNMDKFVEPWISRNGLLLLKVTLLRLTTAKEVERRNRLWTESTRMIWEQKEKNPERFHTEMLMALAMLLRTEDWTETMTDVGKWAAIGKQAQEVIEPTLAEFREEASVGKVPNIGQIMISTVLWKAKRINEIKVLFDGMNELDTETKTNLLEPIDAVVGAKEAEDLLEVALNAPWLAAERESKTEAIALISKYWELYERVETWEGHRVGTYILICISVLENEYHEDREAARRALEKANRTPEVESRLLVAEAKILEQEGLWARALDLRKEAREKESGQTLLNRMITRRADAICAWEAGQLNTAKELFQEAARHGIESGEELSTICRNEETEREVQAYNGRMRIRGLALMLDGYIAQAVEGELDEALKHIYGLALKLTQMPAPDDADGNRLTRVLSHTGLWIQYRCEGWTNREINKRFGIIPGVASREGWPEESSSWEVTRVDHYWAAAYQCALAQMELRKSDELATRLRAENYEILGMELLLNAKQRDYALGKGQWSNAIRYAERAENISKKYGRSLRLTGSRRMGEEAEDRPLSTEHATTMLIAVALKEALKVKGEDTDETVSQDATITREAYLALTDYTSQLDWAEALLSTPGGQSRIHSDNDRALFRIINALYRHRRRNLKAGTRYERWRWGVQVWLFAEVNPSRELIDDALHLWFEAEGLWKCKGETADSRRQNFAKQLCTLMVENELWERDVDVVVRHQLREAAQRKPLIPKLGRDDE